MNVQFGIIVTAPLSLSALIEFHSQLVWGYDEPTELVCAHQTRENLLNLIGENLDGHRPINFLGAEVSECSEVEEGVLEFINRRKISNPRCNGKFFVSHKELEPKP